MKIYNSIPNLQFKDIEGKQVIVFDKLDGSNIRAEWSKKKGFYKFGSRKKLIDANDPQFGEAVGLISEMDKAFKEVFNERKIERAVCFFEFWGQNSAFGSHIDEEHWCTLIDVSVYRKGIIDPETFLEWFDREDILTPKVLYKGLIDQEFYDSVRDGTLEGVGPEGVVCKFGFEQSLGGPWMTKIKRQSWYDSLKSFCRDDEKKYKELE